MYTTFNCVLCETFVPHCDAHHCASFSAHIICNNECFISSIYVACTQRLSAFKTQTRRVPNSHISNDRPNIGMEITEIENNDWYDEHIERSTRMFSNCHVHVAMLLKQMGQTGGETVDMFVVLDSAFQVTCTPFRVKMNFYSKFYGGHRLVFASLKHCQGDSLHMLPLLDGEKYFYNIVKTKTNLFFQPVTVLMILENIVSHKMTIPVTIGVWIASTAKVNFSYALRLSVVVTGPVLSDCAVRDLRLRLTRDLCQTRFRQQFATNDSQHCALMHSIT